MQKPKKQLPNFAKYSSMAFQMGIIILGSAYGGMKLDEYVESLSIPLFTVLFTILSVAVAVYLSIRDLIKTNKK